MRKATLVRTSLTRRSQICRAVTKLAVVAGERAVLTANCIWMVGDRSARNGTANARGESVIVSPMKTSLKTGQPDHVPGVSFRNLDSFQAFEMEDGRDLGDAFCVRRRGCRRTSRPP